MRPTSPSGHGVRVAILVVLLLFSATHADRDGVKTAVFHSPPFVLVPGSVSNKYYNIELPKGHIALKSFDAEVVDQAGKPVPLYETYLHHWLVVRYYALVGTEPARTLDPPERLPAGNSGICPNTLTQFFGLGSETRRTPTRVPDPYGIEVGNGDEIPAGYEERWMLNVHAIDTRGVEDRMGCTECRCDLYNVTARPEGYVGGLFCCRDQARCRLRSGYNDVDRPRKLSLRYTVKWVDWDDAVFPVKIYILDVTFAGEGSRRISRPYCRVEYDIAACGVEGVANDRDDRCVHVERAKAALPRGGDVVYAVGHQHTGALGIALYGQDGRVVCSSIPKYGTGDEAGNEAGYVVGMSVCYPELSAKDPVRIAAGEMLTLESNYSSSQIHTGVMGLFYVLVAEPVPSNGVLLPHLSS